MIRKSKLWFGIFILISGAIILLPFTVHAQTPIPCGQTTAGSISTPGESDSYSFTGSVNDVVTIRGRTTSGSLYTYLELYGPGGGYLGGGTQIDMTLTAAGSYTISMSDYSNTNTGDYLVYWQRLNSPCNVVANVACGQVVSGTIGTAVDPPPWRVYAFSASANDVVTIRATNTSGGNFYPWMELYDPSGVYLSQGNQIDMTLVVAGTYKILLRDLSNAYGGDYVLTWERVKNPCDAVTISCGQVLSGSVSVAGEIGAYTFSASSGDVVTIRMRNTSGGSFYPYVELYDPSGTLIGGPSYQIDVTLPVAGTHTILVRDAYNLYTGDYILYWQRMNSPCNVVANVACGQLVTGTIGTGGESASLEGLYVQCIGQ